MLLRSSTKAPPDPEIHLRSKVSQPRDQYHHQATLFWSEHKRPVTLNLNWHSTGPAEKSCGRHASRSQSAGGKTFRNTLPSAETRQGAAALLLATSSSALKTLQLLPASLDSFCCSSGRLGLLHVSVQSGGSEDAALTSS